MQSQSRRAPGRKQPFVRREKWNGRPCARMGNSCSELVVLAAGGHLAEFRFREGCGLPSLNPLWQAPWTTIDPDTLKRKRNHAYGNASDAGLLSGLAGHNLCFDYFGPPSEAEAACGLPFHGEAPNLRWKLESKISSQQGARIAMSVHLPLANLEFSRTLEMHGSDPVVRFEEIARNPKKTDHYFQWAEHVTLGTPFLTRTESYVVIPAERAMSDPSGYDEGKALLQSGREFRWPFAYTTDKKRVDLSWPFPCKGKGLVTTQLLSNDGPFGFIAAVNSRHSLLLAYVFNKADFPWVVLWDENQAIAAAPWNSRTRARALEFSSSPFPSGRQAAISRGELFGLPSLDTISAAGSKTVRFCAFLSVLPANLGKVNDIVVRADHFEIRDARGRTHKAMASGIESFLSFQKGNAK